MSNVRPVFTVSPEAKALMIEVRDEWIKWGTKTTRINRDAVRNTLKDAYEIAGAKWHDNVIFCDSPHSMALRYVGSKLDPEFELGKTWRREIYRKIREERKGKADSLHLSSILRDEVVTPVYQAANHVKGRSIRYTTPGLDFVANAISEVIRENDPWTLSYLAGFDFMFRWGYQGHVLKLRPHFELFRSCGFWCGGEDIAFVSDRPTEIGWNGEGQVVRVVYGDGFTDYIDARSIKIPIRREDIFALMGESLVNVR